MNNYLVLIIGWIIGQSGYAIIKAYKIQSENEAINFTAAIGIVYKRTASLAMAVFMLALALFLMPEFFKNLLNKADQANTWQMQIITWLRVSSIIYGMFCQWIGLLAFGKLQSRIKTVIDKDSTEKP